MNYTNRFLHILLAALILLLSVSCTKQNSQNDNDPTPEEPTSALIHTYYTNELWNVDRIEILRSDGERKSSEQVDIILNWLYETGHITATINPAPEDYNGVAFTVTLFHGEDKLFFFTPTHVSRHIIISNKELVAAMSSLWDAI